MSVSSNLPSPIGRPTTLNPSNRPKIKIHIPPPTPQGLYYNAASPYLNTAHSTHSQPYNNGPQWPAQPYVNPFASKAGVFEGFKDFTWDWTKTGLNKGEKSVFYLYEKVSRWSKRWFTHIFLMTIVFLYSVAGAYIFIAVEGSFSIQTWRVFPIVFLHIFFFRGGSREYNSNLQ